jgi:hypothetical protein
MLAREQRAAAFDRIELARFSEEDLPPEDMPSGAATPDAGPAADWVVAPASSPVISPAAISSPAAPDASSSALPGDTSAVELEPTPMPSPTDVAPLEVGSVAPQGQISDSSLDPIIQRIRASEPALAASLRLTDQAREQILHQHEDDAVQTLGRAISIEPSNPYAYFYLSRAYMLKKNYPQALTFFKRAELGFGSDPEWLGETFAFEGLANEQSGQPAAAIACYQKAVVSVPGNLMARVGLTRLAGSEQAAPAVQPVSTSGVQDSTSQPQPDEGAIPPPPDSPSPAPATN